MHRAQCAVLWVGCVLVGLSLSTGAIGAASAGGGPQPAPAERVANESVAQTVPEVEIVQSFAALPDRPGHVRARRSFDIPTSVASLRTRLPSDATVTETSPGFSRIEDDQYEWTGGSPSPWIAYTLPVNETGAGRGPEATDGRYSFADVGEWGLFRRPPAPVDVRYRGSAISFDRRTAVDGPGAAGTSLVFVGPSAEYRQEASGQTIRLVVPDAANLRPQREELFRALTDAAASLQVGDRDETVLAIAAPTSVDWAWLGLQTGDADLYVVADESLDSPASTWLHEYVHTRQDFNLTAETRWVPEATATYYAALLSLEQERIGLDAFRDHLGRGTSPQYERVVLADPDTWTQGADYLKGALVAGELDRRLRLATDSRVDLQQVIRRLNEAAQPVTGDDFTTLVGSVGSASVASTADRYTTTSAAPDIWSRTAHDEAFGPRPPRISIRLPEESVDSEYRVSGPYRTGSLAGPPFVLVPDETLTVPVRIANDGGTAGSYNLTYGRVGGPTRTLTGSIGVDESRFENVSVPFDAVGEYTIRIGEFTFPVTVAEPARPTVTAIDVARPDVAVSEAVDVSIDVENSADRPAAGTLNITVDGETIAAERVTLDVGESRTLVLTTRFESHGHHRIAAGNQTTSVTIHTDAMTSTPGGQGPGPGPLITGLTIVLGALLLRHAWEVGLHPRGRP